LSRLAQGECERGHNKEREVTGTERERVTSDEEDVTIRIQLIDRVQCGGGVEISHDIKGNNFCFRIRGQPIQSLVANKVKSSH
jgi:hypothetical protein